MFRSYTFHVHCSIFKGLDSLKISRKAYQPAGKLDEQIARAQGKKVVCVRHLKDGFHGVGRMVLVALNFSKKEDAANPDHLGFGGQAPLAKRTKYASFG